MIRCIIATALVDQNGRQNVGVRLGASQVHRIGSSCRVRGTVMIYDLWILIGSQGRLGAAFVGAHLSFV